GPASRPCGGGGAGPAGVGPGSWPRPLWCCATARGRFGAHAARRDRPATGAGGSRGREQGGGMSRSVNKVILVGHVGRDPDVQTTAAGTKVAHLSLATSRRIPRDGGFEDRTEWHRLTLWDRLAQIVEQYVRKGDRLYVEGRME